eukprot:GHVS01054493.1.p1 GENE.GHVS01054493.1~~GHVS01054493.1.p1  ORF type:complete len:349 (+),score=56.83 GHVS01054493.1:167-1213(+)
MAALLPQWLVPKSTYRQLLSSPLRISHVLLLPSLTYCQHNCVGQKAGPHSSSSAGRRCLYGFPSCGVSSRTFTSGTKREGRSGLEEETSGQDEEEGRGGKEENGEVLKRRLLDGALRHVASLGWSPACLLASAADLKLSPALSGVFIDDGVFSLTDHFLTTNLEALERSTEEDEINLRSITDNTEGEVVSINDVIERLLQLSMSHLSTHQSHYHQYVVVRTRPCNISLSLQSGHRFISRCAAVAAAALRRRLAIACPHRRTEQFEVGELSLIEHYLFFAIWQSAEVFALTDVSTHFSLTQEYIGRRCLNAKCLHSTGEAASTALQSLLLTPVVVSSSFIGSLFSKKTS